MTIREQILHTARVYGWDVDQSEDGRCIILIRRVPMIARMDQHLLTFSLKRTWSATYGQGDRQTRVVDFRAHLALWGKHR